MSSMTVKESFGLNRPQSHFSFDTQLKSCSSAIFTFASKVPLTYFREHVKSYVSVAFPVYTMTLE